MSRVSPIALQEPITPPVLIRQPGLNCGVGIVQLTFVGNNEIAGSSGFGADHCGLHGGCKASSQEACKIWQTRIHWARRNQKWTNNYPRTWRGERWHTNQNFGASRSGLLWAMQLLLQWMQTYKEIQTPSLNINCLRKPLTCHSTLLLHAFFSLYSFCSLLVLLYLLCPFLL